MWYRLSVMVTVIPRGTRVEGLIQTSNDLVVEGEVDGRIEIGGTLTVAAGGSCRAGVRALAAPNAGAVLGDVVCSAAVAVEAGGRVVGNLRAPEVEVSADALVDGAVDLLPPDPSPQPVRRVPAAARGPGVRRPSPPLPVTEVPVRPTR